MSHDAKRDFLDTAALSRLAALQVSARLPMLGSVTGIHRSATRGSSVEFAEYRKYAPGDDIRHVDWRVYGRTDRFYMKEFEADTNLRCYLALDVSASMGFGGASGTKFEYARRLAATLAHLLALQGDAVGLLGFAERTVREIPPRHSPAHLRHVYDALAELKPAGASAIADRLHDLAERVRHRALVIVFSDFFAEPDALLDSFQHMRFRKHDLAVFHLLDRQEAAFAFDRPIRFADLETPFALITDPAVIRDNYLNEFNRHLETLQRGSREFQVDYRRVFTDADYEKVLAAFLLDRMRK